MFTVRRSCKKDQVSIRIFLKFPLNFIHLIFSNFSISDCFVITNQENDLADVFGRLFQVSAAVSDLEGVMKDRDQSDTSLTSQTKD